MSALFAASFSHLNAVQTQVHKTLMFTDDSVLLCAPTGSGKSLCAAMAMARLFHSRGQEGKCAYICPTPEVARAMHNYIESEVGPALGASWAHLGTFESLLELILNLLIFNINHRERIWAHNPINSSIINKKIIFLHCTISFHHRLFFKAVILRFSLRAIILNWFSVHSIKAIIFDRFSVLSVKALILDRISVHAIKSIIQLRA